MQKIRLDMETLAVESFHTMGGGADARGTVHAHLPIETQGRDCDSLDVCTYWYCLTQPTACGTCAATECGTCYDPTCGGTYCGTCDPCVCGCACCGCNPCCCTCCC